MRTAIAFSFAMLAACGPVETPPAPVSATARSTTVAAGGTKAAITTTATSTSPLTVAAANVTRHLPGTAITTATGKYVYLVQDNGTIAPFASAAIAAASGYPASAIVTVSASELNCYGRGNQITAALPAPAAGKLRDGALVKESGKTDTYVVSDSVAWPVRNGNVFTEAGYDWDNVVTAAAGALAAKVDAVGDCVTGVACLDEAYLATCANDDSVSVLPTSTATATATATTTATAAPINTATSTGTATAVHSSGAKVTRHPPGTAITTATGKYIYLVQDDGTAAPFASAAIAAASGYGSDTIITVSATELYCYSRGDQITAALPANESGLQDGALVKEKGKTDTYVVSGGMAWPVKSGAVFLEAGYDWDNVVEIPAGSLAGKVDDIGDCVIGVMCLDEAYLLTCADDETVGLFPTATSTGTATAVATSAPTVTATATATETKTAATAVATATATDAATSTAAPTPTSTVTATMTGTAATATHTASSTAVTTAFPTFTATTTATATATTTGTASATTATTATPSATATATTTTTATNTDPPPPVIDLSWVWSDGGGELCLNAAYFAGDDQAVLLIWSGPGADAAKGPVSYEDSGRFCWDFTGQGKGLYYFWADVPLASCSSDICPRDTVANNGAMYMTAPKATPAARKWLHCEPTGCDGTAYWDGSTLTPMGD